MLQISRKIYTACMFLVCTDAFAHTQDITQPQQLIQLVEQDGERLVRVNGEVEHIGGGTIESWVQLNKHGYQKVGITLSSKTLDINSLPAPAEGHHFDAAIHFPKVAGTPFNNAYIAWKPAGHGSGPMYAAAHYDFHFSFVEAEFLEAITVEGALAQQVPQEGYMPEAWVPARAADGSYASVAGQGVHWHYMNAPEWNGGIFTESFMWGSYAGKNIFMEPMIALKTLNDVDSFEKEIELPACVSAAGFYPTTYGWIHRLLPSGERILDIYLKDFIFMRASCRKHPSMGANNR